jgi:hypothetical protein
MAHHGHEVSCPWCAIEAGVDTPGFSIFGQTGAASTVGTFSKADWNEIEKKLTHLLLPVSGPATASSPTHASQASPQAQDIMKRRREEYERAVRERHAAELQHAEAMKQHKEDVSQIAARNTLAVEAHAADCESAKSEHALLTAKLEAEYAASKQQPRRIGSFIWPASKIGLPVAGALWFIFWLQGGRHAAPMLVHIGGMAAFGAVVTAAVVAYLYKKSTSPPKPAPPALNHPPPPTNVTAKKTPGLPVMPVPPPISWSDTAFADIHRRMFDDTKAFNQAKARHATRLAKEGLLLEHPQFGPAHRQAQALLGLAKTALQLRQYRIDELNGKARKRALKRHLATRRLEENMVDGIGPSRIGTLRSFGVYTAADIDPSSLSSIPGIGPVLQGNLVSWRSRIVGAWVPPTHLAPTAADIASVDAAIAQERSGLAQKALQLINDMERIRGDVVNELTRSANLVNELAMRAGQSEADLRHLKTTFP